MVAKQLMSEQETASFNPCTKFDNTIRCCKIGGLGSPLSGSCDKRTVEQGGEKNPHHFPAIKISEIAIDDFLGILIGQ